MGAPSHTRSRPRWRRNGIRLLADPRGQIRCWRGTEGTPWNNEATGVTSLTIRNRVGRRPVLNGDSSLHPRGADDPDGFRRLFDVTAARTGLPLRGVVHLWSLDAGAGEDLTVTELQRAQAVGCGSAVSLLRAMADRSNLRGAGSGS